jgi:ubiquinone/menaquinone biosynthesis C-methylase UbiE
MDIWECALGFMDSKILLTAEELGVFNELENQPLTSGEIASKTGLPHGSAERLLNGLCGLELLQKTRSGKYKNSDDASRMLVKGKDEYIGDIFDHLRNELYPLWGHMKEALKEGKRQSHILNNGVGSSKGKDKQSLEKFFSGMHKITYKSASEYREYLDGFDNIKDVVDIGGATGAFLIALAERFPSICGTVMDFEHVKPFMEKNVKKKNLEERVNFLPGDFFEDPIPKADAYILSFILHDWETESGSYILYKISEAAKPGSLLLVSEYFMNEDKTGLKHVLRSDLNMLVAARGMERTAGEYTAWLKDHKFELIQQLMDTNERGLLVARRM